MKKILMITRNFPPLTGGMERLNHRIYEIFSKKNDVTLLGPKGAKNFCVSQDVHEFSSSPVWLYLISSLIKALLLSRRKYDVIFCGSGTSIVAGYIASKLSSAKLVCYVHGLDVVADSLVYQFCFVKLIARADLLIANSQNTKRLAIKAGISSEKIYIINPGVDIPNQASASEEAIKFRNLYKVNLNPILLIVGRLTERKGVPEFLHNIMPQLVSNYPEIRLFIIGGGATDAIGSKKNTLSKVESTISNLRLNDNVFYLGVISDELLNSAYFAADLMIFPILNIPGDVEGFGMVAVEAAAHGLPTVGFASGGAEDSISHGVSGWLVDTGNYIGMEEFIDAYLSKKNPLNKQACIEHANNFNWDLFEKKIIDHLDL